MRKRTIMISVIVAFFAVSLLLTQVSLAQEAIKGAQPQIGWTIDMPAVEVQNVYFQELNMAAKPIVTVTGEVRKIDAPKALPTNLVMMLKTEEGIITVWLGPKWFVLSQKLKFNAGDTVEVRGLQYKAGNIIASEISKGDYTMVLRSEGDGMPNWECCIPRVRK